MSRPLLPLLGAAGAAALGSAAWARAALADSEPPPPGTFTESNTGALVVLTLAVVAIVLVSVVVLRRVGRTRCDSPRSPEERRAHHGPGGPDEPPDAGEGTTKEAP
jgi:hypothetical protein